MILNTAQEEIIASTPTWRLAQLHDMFEHRHQCFCITPTRARHTQAEWLGSIATKVGSTLQSGGTASDDRRHGSPPSLLLTMALPLAAGL